MGSSQALSLRLGLPAVPPAPLGSQALLMLSSPNVGRNLGFGCQTSFSLLDIAALLTGPDSTRATWVP